MVNLRDVFFQKDSDFSSVRIWKFILFVIISNCEP